MNILGIVPARAGSKRVERKNVRDLAGKPLIAHTFEVAKQCNSLSRLIVSTNDPEVVEIANKMGIEVPFIRPEEFCTDTATDFDWVNHAYTELSREEENIDVVVIMRPTSPFRKQGIIDDAINIILKGEVDSVRSMSPVKHHPFWMKQINNGLATPYINNGLPDEKLRSQDLPKLFRLNGNVDVIKTSNLVKGSLYGDRMGSILMDSYYDIDIDTPEDFAFCEFLIKSNIINCV